MIAGKIIGTSRYVTGKKILTKDLAAEVYQDFTPEEIEQKTGVKARYWVPRDVTCADMGAEALKIALQRAGLKPSDLKRVLFVCSSGGDYLFPATVNQVIDKLGMRRTCDGFDLNNACVGFMTALDLAFRTVSTGFGPVAVVCAEISTRYMSKELPREYVVLADAAAAAIVSQSQDGEGILASFFGNDPEYFDTVVLNHPAVDPGPAMIWFGSSNHEMSVSVRETFKESVNQVLQLSGCCKEDVEWLVPHQPNGRMLDDLIDCVGFDHTKTVKFVADYGTFGSVTVPFGLDLAIQDKRYKKGDKILMAGVGAGVGYGALLYQS